MKSQYRRYRFVALVALATGLTDLSGNAMAQEARFQLHGGEVYDNQTHLTWQRCTYGTHYVAHSEGGDEFCVGPIHTMSPKEAYSLSVKSGWRLPTKAEFESLATPEHDTHAFGDAYYDEKIFMLDSGPSQTFWIVPPASGPAARPAVFFLDGDRGPTNDWAYIDYDDGGHPVLLVRDGR
ncbi:MAG: DUF1566 domain-containing protein [Pseudomonadota bacterium]|nr:DUF1566 domain-containing protein [Pseudomonadota bacterium]